MWLFCFYYYYFCISGTSTPSRISLLGAVSHVHIHLWAALISVCIDAHRTDDSGFKPCERLLLPAGWCSWAPLKYQVSVFMSTHKRRWMRTSLKTSCALFMENVIFYIAQERSLLYFFEEHHRQKLPSSSSPVILPHTWANSNRRRHCRRHASADWHIWFSITV